MSHICMYCGKALFVKQAELVCLNSLCKLFRKEQFKLTDIPLNTEQV
jgi:Leu/Phe-tRNA-protein transferase